MKRTTIFEVMMAGLLVSIGSSCTDERDEPGYPTRSEASPPLIELIPDGQPEEERDGKPDLVQANGNAGAEEAEDPERAVVEIGAYINDIQAIDLRSHSYVVDLYIWFRWRKDDIDPGTSFEFMNMFNPQDHTKSRLFDDPLPQPDGAHYILYRHQGAFSSKFPVGSYPFDNQELKVVIEDSEQGSEEFVYVADGLAINPSISLPGYSIGDARLVVNDFPYVTNFGDRDPTYVPTYSRAVITVPIVRPWLTGAIKSFLPIFLIILCSATALLLQENFVEARVGLSITALLALVALQYAAVGNLPEVGYLLMLDQIFIASYGFILVTLAIIVGGSGQSEGEVKGRPTSTLLFRGVTTSLSLIGYAAVVAAVIAYNVGALTL